MWLAFIITVVFIFYGSVYPFNFHYVPLNLDLFEAFLESWQIKSSRGDAFGNVVLFIPFGAMGMLAYPRFASWKRAALVAIAGVSVAVISQLAQYYVPARVPALQDVAWNLLGLVVGLGFGAAVAEILRRWQHRRDFAAVDVTPLFLIGLWLTVRLLPFVPTIDLQTYKNSLKPLLLDPVFSFPLFLVSTASWLAVALLLIELRGPRHFALLLIALGGATLALEVVIVVNVVSFTDVVSLAAALLLGLAIVRWAPNPAIVVAGVIVFALIYNGLAPFRLSGEVGTFRWIPFGATLRGHLLFSTQLIVFKLFFYGALVWFLDRAHIGSRLRVIVVATGLVAAIEVAQLFFTRHTPEITDPILVLLGAAIVLAARRGHHSATRGLSAIMRHDLAGQRQR